jgi:hypothetical protein
MRTVPEPIDRRPHLTRQSAVRLITVVAGSCSLSACYNLDAVQSVSGKVTSATATWDAAGSEMEQSCFRRNQLGTTPDDCKSDKAATEGLLAADKIMHDYFGAIQATANQQNFSVDQGIKDLSSSVAKVPGVNAGQVQAVSGLAGLLINLALGAYREHALRVLINDGAPHARNILDFLQSTAADDIATDLQSEQIRLTEVFSRQQYIPNITAKLGSDLAAGCTEGPLTSRFTNGPEYLMALEFCRRQTDIRSKQKAIDNYKKSVAKAREALDQLQSSKVRLTSRQMAGRLYQIGQDLDENVNKVRKAFGRA